MDWILILALGTFALVIAFLLWNRQSTKRHQETGGNTSGAGGPNDPLSGTAEGIRDAADLRQGLNEASEGPKLGLGNATTRRPPAA